MIHFFFFASYLKKADSRILPSYRPPSQQTVVQHRTRSSHLKATASLTTTSSNKHLLVPENQRFLTPFPKSTTIRLDYFRFGKVTTRPPYVFLRPLMTPTRRSPRKLRSLNSIISSSCASVHKSSNKDSPHRPLYLTHLDSSLTTAIH